MSESYRPRVWLLLLWCSALMVLGANGGCEQPPREEAGGSGRTTRVAEVPSAPEARCSDDEECASDDPCMSGECDDEPGRCRISPVDDGTPCDDGLYCTVLDRCIGGACEGAGRICEAPDGSCAVAWCDEATNTCNHTPRPDGTTCGDDGDLCTTSRCIDGVCTVEPRDCSHLNDRCRIASCDDETGGCTYQWRDTECVPGQEESTP